MCYADSIVPSLRLQPPRLNYGIAEIHNVLRIIVQFENFGEVCSLSMLSFANLLVSHSLGMFFDGACDVIDVPPPLLIPHRSFFCDLFVVSIGLFGRFSTDFTSVRTLFSFT